MSGCITANSDVHGDQLNFKRDCEIEKDLDEKDIKTLRKRQKGYFHNKQIYIP